MKKYTPNIAVLDRTSTAYGVLAAIVAVWLGLLTWALGLAEPRDRARARATVASQWPPPVAPA